jgi:hypothetical protein
MTHIERARQKESSTGQQDHECSSRMEKKERPREQAGATSRETRKSASFGIKEGNFDDYRKIPYRQQPNCRGLKVVVESSALFGPYLTIAKAEKVDHQPGLQHHGIERVKTIGSSSSGHLPIMKEWYSHGSKERTVRLSSLVKE